MFETLIVRSQMKSDWVRRCQVGTKLKWMTGIKGLTYLENKMNFYIALALESVPLGYKAGVMSCQLMMFCFFFSFFPWKPIDFIIERKKIVDFNCDF